MQTESEEQTDSKLHIESTVETESKGQTESKLLNTEIVHSANITQNGMRFNEV